MLHYISNTKKRYKTFVANRIATIHGSSSPKQWRHVPTDMNPADDASRGLGAEQITSRERWSKGPEFLRANSDDWPKNPVIDFQDKLDGDVEVIRRYLRSEPRSLSHPVLCS